MSLFDQPAGDGGMNAPMPPQRGGPSQGVVVPEPELSPLSPRPVPHASLPPSSNPESPDRFFNLPEQQRFLGPGHPLIQESWKNRPFSLGSFVGLAQGGDLIDNWIRQDQGLIGGARLGWDFDDYWGCEMRVAIASMEIVDSQLAKDAQRAADDAAGLSPNDRSRRRFDGRRDNEVCFWDVSVLYYPWGDAQWRPFFLLGFGSADFEYVDRLSTLWADTVFELPIGIGVKYRQNECLAVRLELMDNIVFGGDSMEDMHILTLTAGAELRFGGSRCAYWPWNPGRHYW